MARKKYRTVSLPIGLADDIQELMDEFGYWPSVGAFVREATVRMVTEWQDRLKEPDSAGNRGTVPAPESEETLLVEPPIGFTSDLESGGRGGRPKRLSER